MNLDFLNDPVDFQTAYFIIFGLAAIYAVIMVTLVQLDDRRRRLGQQGAHENRTNP